MCWFLTFEFDMYHDVNVNVNVYCSGSGSLVGLSL
jgi:hypothetical protein